MIEATTIRTYDEAFARAHTERAEAFRNLFGFGQKRDTRDTRGSGWSFLRLNRPA